MNTRVPIQSSTPAIDVLTDPGVLWSAQRAEWDALLSRSPSDSIFLTAAWLGAWATTIGRNVELLGITLRRSGQLVAAAVFEVNDGVLLFAGRGASDYSDILIDDAVPEAERARLFAEILTTARNNVARFRYFQLDRLRAVEPAGACADQSSGSRLLRHPQGNHRGTADGHGRGGRAAEEESASNAGRTASSAPARWSASPTGAQRISSLSSDSLSTCTRNAGRIPLPPANSTTRISRPSSKP